MSVLSIFTTSPWLAVLPAIAFSFVASRGRRAMAWTAAFAWLLYAIYETGIQRRILCSGDCSIRVDLLLVYPILLSLSLAALIIATWDGWRARRAER